MAQLARKNYGQVHTYALLRLCVCVSGIVALLSGIPTLAQDVRPMLSTRAQALMSEAWTDSSFARAIAIIAEKTEAQDTRSVAMELLHSNRLKLKPNEMRQLLQEVARIAKDVESQENLAAQAIQAMANLTLTMKELGQLNRAEATKEVGFLLNTITDSRRNIHLRSQAINAVGTLSISEAFPILGALLNPSTYLNLPEIARPACLSLMRIDREGAIPVLADVLRKTSDSRVFGTAAFALGQINTRQTMSALVQNIERFPESSSCDAALVEMGDVILDVIKNAQDERLIDGIRATRHLWREGQRARYIPALQGLLTTAPPDARKAALERLLEAASTQEFEHEKRELTAILELIKDQDQLSEYQGRIRERLAATRVAPDSGVTTPVQIKKNQER